MNFWRGPLIPLASLAVLLIASSSSVSARQSAQHRRLIPKGGEVTLEADQQKQVGKVFYADGNVDVIYEKAHFRADHVMWNQATGLLIARGHVQFDYESQHLAADSASYNLKTGRGSFQIVKGTITAERRPQPNLLASSNPLYFHAAQVDIKDENTIVVHHASMTVCRPDLSIWKFHAPKATIHMQKTVALDNATFRIFSVPVIYLPYATVPVARKPRQSGFLVPEVGNSSTRGYFLGDSFYWAPTDWMDATVGAEYLSKRGSSENAELRMRPWQNARLNASYFGVIDRGISVGGTLMKQGGHEYHLFFDSRFPHGWRGVADIDQLSSLTFRLAFAETFSQAVNSEVNDTSFLVKNTDGYSLSLATLSYKNFLSASPQTDILLRTAPELRASSVDRAPWRKLPIYLGFNAFADAMHRETNVSPGFETPSFVSRMEFAPDVTIPLHLGDWLGVTPSFTLRATRYGGQIQNGAYVSQPLLRTTEEFSLRLQPPSLARVWNFGATKWKHVIEPDFEYHYVNGVNDFARFLLFDEDDTLTDTNDIQYGVTQRLFRRQGQQGGEEFLSWSLQQKYFFDPAFGGALIPGERNVFQALDSLTPFAFADRLHRFSPIISDIRVQPGGRYDAQFRVDFDPVRGQVTAIGTLLKIRPYGQSFLTLAHFSTTNIPPTSPSNPSLFEPRSDQIRALVGYGDLNRKGWNTALGFSYDISQQLFQNEVAQVSYNGSCCGIGFEYRRLALGPVRTDNQFRIVFRIANIGSFGSQRRQESLF